MLSIKLPAGGKPPEKKGCISCAILFVCSAVGAFWFLSVVDIPTPRNPTGLACKNGEAIFITDDHRVLYVVDANGKQTMCKSM